MSAAGRDGGRTADHTPTGLVQYLSPSPVLESRRSTDVE